MRGGEGVEKAEDKMGARFSRDEIEVDFMKGAHALSEGAVASWVTISFICVRGFLRRYSLIKSDACT